MSLFDRFDRSKQPPRTSVVRSGSVLQLSDTTATRNASTLVEHTPTAHPLQHSLVFGQRDLALAEDLATCVSYETCLNERLGLSTALAAQVAVLAVDVDGSHAVLLLTRGVGQDLLSSLLTQMERHRVTLVPNDQTQAWWCAPALVMAVVGGEITGDISRRTRSLTTDAARSGHWEIFKSVIQWAFDEDAQDIDFVLQLNEIESFVRFKVHSRWVAPSRWRLPTEQINKILSVAWQQSLGGASTELQVNLDQQAVIALSLNEDVRLRLRWNTMPTDKGATITIRLQRLGAQRLVKTLEEAEYLPTQIEILERVVTGKGGLTTFSGTVGSGKSVSLAILMDLMHARRPDLKGVSFEDPVEIESSWMDMRTITRDLYAKDDQAFRTAVQSLFRSALDVFMLGEVRDSDAGRTLRAVLDSGHSCFTTTHASDCLTGIVSKFTSAQVGIPASMLATPGMLKLNVYQALLLKNCPFCALSAQEHQDTLKGDPQRGAFSKLLDDIELVCPGVERSTLRFHNPHGCEHCRRDGMSMLNGFAGRTVAAEMVEPDDRMCEIIQKEDMPGLRRYWRGLSDGNVTSPHFEGKTAMEVAMHKSALGLIDPREVEKEFDAFSTLAAKAKAQQRLAPRSSIAWSRVGSLGPNPEPSPPQRITA